MRRGWEEPRREFVGAPAGKLQSFDREEDRARLSPTAVKAFRNIAERWDLTNPEAAALLGVSQSTWERMKRGAREDSLSQDQMTRISAMVGIFQGPASALCRRRGG